MLATAMVLPVVAAVIVYSRLSGGTPSTGLASFPPPGRYKGSEPPAQIQMPQFALRNYRGGVIRSSELLGKVTLVTFLDTDCTTKCPIIAAQIGDGLRLLKEKERQDVVPLAISVNPASDTPRSVRTFLHRRQAERLDFLLGTVKKLRPVWRSFHIVAAAETGSADIHSADVRIFDRRGIWVSTQHAGVDLSPRNLAHDIRVALRANQGLTSAALKDRFAVLSDRHSNKCGLRPESLDATASHGRLQGSCCSPMTFSRYAEQRRALASYANVAEIPSDPYDVSVDLAKRLTSYANDVKLTLKQQITYDQAVKMADEHGPCCCHCWRWTAFEGQAKYLITRRHFGANQIAHIWNLEDGCGGA